MPIYSVQGPDGRIYDVEGPAGASQEQIIAAVRRQLLLAPAAPQAKGSGLGDIARSFGMGAVGAAGAVASAFGADNAAARKLGEVGESLQAGLSAERQAELKQQAERMKKAEESGSTWEEVKAGLLNVVEAPLQSAAQAVGSVVPMLATAPLAKLGLGVRAMMAVRGAIGGAQGAGAVKQSVFDAVMNAEQQDGKSPEQARAAAEKAQAYIGANLDQIVAGAGLGAVAGTTGAERLIPGGARAQAGAVQQALAKRIGERGASALAAAAAEAPLESLQGGQERLAANLALQRTGRDVGALTGVAGQAAQEALMGGLGGGAFGAALPDRSASMAARRQQEEEQRRVAAEAEAAKNAPEALLALEQQFRAADTQLQELNTQIKALEKGKKATPEEKAQADALKKQRDELLTTYKPLRQEYQQRKGAIDELRAQQDMQAQAAQTQLETQAAAEQPAAKLPLPSDLPQAEPFQLTDTARLMDQYDRLRGQVTALEQQLAAGPDVDTQAQLMEQREQLRARMQEMEPVIAERGGTTESEETFTKQVKAAEKERLRLLELGDFDAAAKQAQKVKDLQARAPFFEELKAYRATPVGGTREMFTAETPQPEAEGIKYVSPEGKPIEPFAATAAEAAPLAAAKPEELAKTQAAESKVAQAQTQLDEVVKSKDMGKLYETLDTLNKAQDEASRAKEEVGRPALKPAVLDIFSPANVINEAYQRGDAKLLGDLATHADRTALRAALDKTTNERDQLVKILDSRLDLGGTERAAKVTFAPEEAGGKTRTVEKGKGEELRSVKRERADLFGQLFTPKLQAEFKNGTYPDKEMQSIYDKGGPAAVEYETVMRNVEALAKKVTTKQGNAKDSLYEQMIKTYAELEALKAQMESGVATPTMREKVAGAQAKLGKGEAPAERPMNEAEKYQLKRKIDATTNKYNMLVGKITPVRDQILKLYNSLYKTTPLEKPSEVAAKKAKAAAEAAKGPKAVSRTAKTAARLARGDVRREAETSQKMRDLARELGQREPEYEKFNEQLTRRLEALKKKYGPDDQAVNAFRISMGQERIDKAEELGKKTPEYKATLKEQIAYFKEVLPTAGKQEVPTKRTPQVTRKQSGAPKRLVSSSPESLKQSKAENEALSLKRRAFKDMQEALDSEKYGTAYRLKEGEAATKVDAEQAQKVVDGLKLPETVKFVYAPTADKIPVKLLREMAKDGVDVADGMVKGAVFPDGTVLVVGDQHADVTDLEQTIAHELIGHYGIDTVIGLDRLKSYVKKTDVVELAERIGGKPLVSEVLNTVRALKLQGRDEDMQKLQALREVIAHTEEAKVTEAFREKAGRWLKELVGMVRAGLRDMGLLNAAELSTSDVFYMLKQSRKAFTNKAIGPYRAADGTTAFRLRKQSSQYESVGSEPSTVDKVMTNMLGLAGRVQYVDQYSALEAAIRKGLDANVISDLEATNANYLLRFGQQRSQFAGQFLTNGPVKAVHTKKDGGVETVYKSTKGVSMMDVAQELNKAKVGNDTEREHMFTLYLAGKRAEQVGWEKLNFSAPTKAKAEYQDVLTKLAADKDAKAAFDEAAKLYQQYNAGLLDFLVDTGAMSAKKAAELKSISYVPFYRINANGEVQLMIDKEHPVRISSIKEQPQLKELIGGNTAILPVFTSAAQNTFMLTDMGLRNQAVKETAFVLKKLGIASAVRPGKGPASPDVVRFYRNGEPYYALIDTDAFGVPAELIVRGMEGIKTTLPAVVKLLGIPADILRSFVVRNPAYAVRQIIRDPLNAWMTTGTDAVPVLSSMKELATMVAGRSDAERKLMESGAISSNVFSGDERDMSKFLKDMAAGKPLWAKAVAQLDAFALQGDAATRAVIYKDSLAKGMTEQEALLRTLESMNFSRRGVSPSMHALSILIPFFNAQIQGLDVIYRAMAGKMPYSEQLKIREKMVRRGAVMAGLTLAYAAFMEDDEAYKRARPEERYSNWFVHVPGISEPVRVPIPFEMGFLFKALPEAIYNMAMQDENASKAMSGLFKLAAQTVPLSLPQSVKPLTEAVLGKSFYSGDIESGREKQVMATERYRENTTELSKLLGSVTGKVGISPITIDYLIRGYTGGLGIALIQLANPLLASDEAAAVEKPSLKPSKVPFIGGLFQPVEGRGTLDEAYDRMQEIQQAKGTFNDMIEKGKRAEALAFAQQYADKIGMMSVSGAVQKRLGDLAAIERQIRSNPNMSAEQKDTALEQLDKAKMAVARQFLAVTSQR